MRNTVRAIMILILAGLFLGMDDMSRGIFGFASAWIIIHFCYLRMKSV